MTQPPPPHKANGSAAEGGDAPQAGPSGLTYREQQRRRIVIAGLTAPTLMTLPSRRAWSAACSKSKLKKISGNLSAKKQIAANCDNIGCRHTFWKTASNWPLVGGGPMPNDSFEGTFLVGFAEQMYEDGPSMVRVLDLKGSIRKEDSNGNDTIYKALAGELKAFNRAAAAALVNAFYLNNMNFIVGFHIPGTMGYTNPPGTSPGEVVTLYAQYLNDAIAVQDNNIIKAGRQFFEDQNNALGGCPLK